MNLGLLLQIRDVQKMADDLHSDRGNRTAFTLTVLDALDHLDRTMAKNGKDTPTHKGGIDTW